MTPRSYLSWSQYNIFKRSPETYRKLYILGEKGFDSKYMRFGKQMALMREGVENAEDELVQSILTFLPQYPRREHEMTAKVKVNGKTVVLFGKFDGVDLRKHIIGDDKVGLAEHITKKGNKSKVWTQKKVDGDKQITFYSYIYYLNKKIIPKFQLNWIETIEENGEVVATGNIKTFETTRTVKDFIKLQANINKVWTGIVDMVDQEWAGVV